MPENQNFDLKGIHIFKAEFLSYFLSHRLTTNFILVQTNKTKTPLSCRRKTAQLRQDIYLIKIKTKDKRFFTDVTDIGLYMAKTEGKKSKINEESINRVSGFIPLPARS